MSVPRGKRILMRGNEALAQAAMDAGCRAFFGYPITPQNQVPDYFARHMPAVGGVFLQAESEVAAINMVYGAAAAGARVMTASSSPGISLKQEGISYLAQSELPCVIVNIMRGGSGLGNIAPAQADYFQSVKGGGHGDYRTLVFAPWSIQELYDLTREAFDIADRYRNPVLILGDALLGQMMEVRVAEEHLEDAEVAIIAYGTAARVAVTAAAQARSSGMRVGLMRPISLYPFPTDEIASLAGRVKAILVVELSLGQLVEDVQLAVSGRCPVHLLGRSGGVVMTPAEVVEALGRVVEHSRG
jgi:2-oxoglutarate ferredoxin oxidoreductase subunit alpha